METSAQEQSGSKRLYDYQAEDLSGNKVSLAQYAGKVALVVNTASRCGFTPQYADLEAVYQDYKGKGFVVLGFPSNDFGGQEPGSNAEIKNFCELKYKTTFPVFAKGPVSGKDKQPIYRFLTEMSHSDYRGDPGWNFVKFLINKDGEVVGRFSALTKPTSKKVRKAIEKLLEPSTAVAK